MTSYTDIFGDDTVPPAEQAYIRHSITTNGQLVWPYQFAGDDLLTADITEITSSVGALQVRLPPANEVSVGQDILIRNVGANEFSILDFAGGAITTVPAGISKYLYVTDNTTEAGVWASFTYGAGTSAADASALAGPGLEANSGGKLQTTVDVQGVGSNYTILVTDRAELIEVVSGSVTISLPQASVAGNGFYVLIRNSSAGSLTVDPFGTETIDGLLTKTLFPGESAIFITNGSYWVSVGYGRDATFVFSEVVVNAALPVTVLSSSDVAGRMIRVSGTAVGNIEVVLPSIDNIYFVNVESGIGAFSVTFRTAGVGTVVVLTANQSTALYSDGTNITTAINTILVASLALADGSPTAPAIRFSLDLDTGIYRSGDGTVSISSNGVETVRMGPLGVELGSVAEFTTFVPFGTIGSTNVQDAIEEILTEGDAALAAHIADPTGAHAASAISNVPAGNIAATDVQAALNELDADKVPRTATTGAAVVPAGTTAQRPGGPLDGFLRYNSTTLQFEGFFNGNWQSVGGGQLLGNALVKAIFYNSTTIAENLTVLTNTNGLSAGPVTINDGFTVTIPDGSVWTVV